MPAPTRTGSSPADDMLDPNPTPPSTPKPDPCPSPKPDPNPAVSAGAAGSVSSGGSSITGSGVEISNSGATSGTSGGGTSVGSGVGASGSGGGAAAGGGGGGGGGAATRIAIMRCDASCGLGSTMPPDRVTSTKMPKNATPWTADEIRAVGPLERSWNGRWSFPAASSNIGPIRSVDDDMAVVFAVGTVSGGRVYDAGNGIWPRLSPCAPMTDDRNAIERPRREERHCTRLHTKRRGLGCSDIFEVTYLYAVFRSCNKTDSRTTPPGSSSPLDALNKRIGAPHTRTTGLDEAHERKARRRPPLGQRRARAGAPPARCGPNGRPIRVACF